MPTRRNFMIGAGAAAAASALPLKLLARPTPSGDSVIFHSQKEPLAFILRPRYFTDGNQPWYTEDGQEIAFAIHKCAKPFFNMDPMRLLGPKGSDYDFHYYWMKTWDEYGDRSSPIDQNLRIHLDRPKEIIFVSTIASNRVAKMSRRGKANNLIIHPDNPYLPELKKYDTLLPHFWTIHERDWIQPNHCLFFYKSSATPIDVAATITPEGLVCPEMNGEWYKPWYYTTNPVDLPSPWEGLKRYSCLVHLI